MNRLVRSRLLTSCLLSGTYAIGAALAAYAPLPPGVAAEIRAFDPLLLAFGIATLVIVVAVNPWRQDRLPDRFPTIVQDAMIIGLFALVALLFMQEKILATTAVGAVVVGFALQDTLGNLFSGLAIQIDKPFRVGHWVTIGGVDGRVTEVTWRATRLRTKAGNSVIVPNSNVAKLIITNYSEPTLDTRMEIVVGASYDTPPNVVKAVIAQAIQDDPLFTRYRDPEIFIVDFAPSSINYLIRVWTNDFDADTAVHDHLRSYIYYAFRRHHIMIPYPIQVEYHHAVVDQAAAPPPPRADVLNGVDVLAPLTEAQRTQLLRAARHSVYAAGETIVREGDQGTSMFVVLRGEAVVKLRGADGEVARLQEGAFFGEMSLLTGEPRTATVIAATDCDALEIDADAFRTVVLGDPAIVEAVTTAVGTRRAVLEQHRAANATTEESPETPQSFVARVRQFLRLST